MSFRRLLLVMTISLVFILIGLLGTSYAYYDLTAPEGEEETRVGNNVIIEDVYIEPEFITIFSSNDIIDLSSKMVKNNFYVMKNDGDFSDKEVYVEIELDDILIDESLKNSNFHYQLLENSEIILSGTGEDFIYDNFKLKENTKVSYDKTYNYDFIIWCDDEMTEYDNLFSAKIKVITLVK